MAPFDTLTRTQKRDLIIAEGFTEQTQITMSPAAVDKFLVVLAEAPKNKLDAWGYGIASSTRSIIKENWGIDIADFPALHHKRDFRPSEWETRLLAALAILSEFTPGQGDKMGTLLCNAVELRVGHGRVDSDLVVKIVDVRRTIKDLLQPLREEDEAEERRRARKRKAEYDARKKAGVRRKWVEEEDGDDVEWEG